MKLSDKVKGIIGAVAPKLGLALGGPLGGLAGNLIASAVGGDEAQVEAAILGQDPAVLMALKKAEQDFSVRMRELDIDESKLSFADTANARELAKTDMRPHMILSTAFVVGYFVLMTALLFWEVKIPDDLHDTFNVLLGVLTVNIPIIMGFWFGSSHGSMRKTEMMKP